ncbi:MAG: hypothetical protein JWO78_2505 [Micavibrio sp.]|nr:hypothetical protein [Micavibrio sp.]
MTPRTPSLRKVNTLIVILLLCLTFTLTRPAFADPPWTITEGRDAVSLFEMPKDGNTYQLSRAYYDAVNKRFLLDMLVGPAATVNISGRKAILVLDPNTRKSFWAAQRPNLSDARYIFPLPPAGTTMFLNSALNRLVGTQNFVQPFGRLEAVLRASEQKYSKMTMLKNYDNPGNLVSKTFGKGEITWTIRDYQRKPLFALKEEYEANSHDYAGFWTPDGQYFFMILPGNVYLTMGAFPVEVMDIMLQSHLDDVRDRVRDEIRLDDRMLAGEISPDEHYGQPYINLINRLGNCGELETLTGKITDLTLHPPGSLQNFGFPYPAGKHLIFDFKSEKDSGTLKANIITYQKEEDAFGKYKEWLQTIVILNTSGVTTVTCP